MRKKRDVTCGIYKIENIVNGKVYIGQSKNCELRWWGHKNEAKKGKNKNHLYRAIRKYGENKFKFTIIERTTIDKLNERECYWIWLFKSTNPKIGYNKTYGGEGVKPTPETLIKMSITSKNRHYKASEETRIILSKKSKQSRWITNGVEDKAVKDLSSIPDGWFIGKSKVVNINNGKINKRISQNEKIPEGWFLGLLEKENKERKIYMNKNEKNKMVALSELDNYLKLGYVVGMAVKGRTGRIWINNGIVSKMIYPYEVDKYTKIGFHIGRV